MNKGRLVRGGVALALFGAGAACATEMRAGAYLVDMGNCLVLHREDLAADFRRFDQGQGNAPDVDLNERCQKLRPATELPQEAQELVGQEAGEAMGELLLRLASGASLRLASDPEVQEIEYANLARGFIFTIFDKAGALLRAGLVGESEQ